MSKQNKPKPAEAVQPAAPILPVYDLIIRADTRTGEVTLTILGGVAPFDDLYKMLDIARDALRRKELEALALQVQAKTGEKEGEGKGGH